MANRSRSRGVRSSGARRHHGDHRVLPACDHQPARNRAVGRSDRGTASPAARGRTDRYAQAMTRSTRAWLRRASRRPALPRDVRRFACIATLAAAVLVLAACGSAAIPVVSFDPASACTTDGRQPGAYPELEALLPAAYQGKAPDNVDSGRNCTRDALGTLADAGVPGVRFAGATWGLGGTSALTVAVFEGDGLTPDEMLDFYAESASTDRHTDKLSTTDVTVGDASGRRL